MTLRLSADGVSTECRVDGTKLTVEPFEARDEPNALYLALTTSDTTVDPKVLSAVVDKASALVFARWILSHYGEPW